MDISVEENGTVVAVAVVDDDVVVYRTGTPSVGPLFAEFSIENGPAVSLPALRGNNCACPSAS